ncbi:peptidase U32 family protein, partial [Desulfobacterales bacterium HSG16]|nr:peptidase U32 family protein [Desulfobacterales bacterium HSG16]
MNKKSNHPLILAPAGNRASFMAAVAAGADAIYCGLKQHSARMEAKNFSIEELSILAPFAHEKGILLYIAMNSLIRPDDLLAAGRAIDLLNRHVHPDALIIQDISLISMARKAGFQKEIHLSTLANAGFPEALKMIGKIEGVDCVVIPRELDIDEIKQMAAACPDRLSLEIFIHGALCYGVSGRCYWSSFFGGKSGLRGRCVQPCRRFYSQGEKREKFFSCLDLGLDVLVRTVEKTNKIRAWKIEGRKKG